MSPDELLARYYVEHEGRDLDLQQFILRAINGQWGACPAETAQAFLDQLEVILIANASARGGGTPGADDAASAISQEIQKIRTRLQCPSAPEV